MRAKRTSSPRRRLLEACVVVVSLCLPLAVASPVGAAGPGCTSPPPVFDLSTLTPHMVGVGYTTIEGSTPTTFDVDVLGAIPDGFMLGVDLIVGRITGPQSFFDNAGGIFYGMSGSPVYVNGDKDSGELLGAVSYSYWPDQSIIGLTPAQSMLDLFDRPTADFPRPARKVALTPSLQRAIARTGTTSIGETSGSTSMQLLPTLVGTPLQGKRLRQFRRMLNKQNMYARVVHAGGAASASMPVSGDDFEIGEPIASIVAYGDAATWAAGITTIACANDQVAMYGHSIFWETPGAVTLGMNGVDVLGISHAAAWYNDMIPVVADTRGSVTADRFAGEVGEVGLEPPTVPITSQFSSPQTGDVVRSGETDAVFVKDYWFEDEAWSHMVSNLDAVFQQISPGTSDLAWTLTLQDKNGVPYTVTNREKTYSSWDATEGIWKLLSEIEQLTWSGFGPVTFTGLQASGSITDQNLTGTIVKVRTASGLAPRLRQRSVLKVKPGRYVTIEVTQEPVEGGANVVTTFRLRVPHSSGGEHRVTVRGGYDRFWASGGAGSLAELVDALSGGEHADDLIVSGIGGSSSQQSSLIVDGKYRLTLNVVG